MTVADTKMTVGEVSARFIESAMHVRTSGDANQPYLQYLQQVMSTQHGVRIGLRGPEKRPVPGGTALR